MNREKIVVNDDGRLCCPACGEKYNSEAAVRRHAKVRHALLLTTRNLLTVEQRREKNAAKVRAWRLKHKKKTTHSQERSRRYTISTADRRGLYNAKHPIVVVKTSLIEGAGLGVFAATDLLKGDWVTRYEGAVVKEKPENPYVMALIGTDKFIDGLKIPRQGKGVGSFINREVRMKGMKRRNCRFCQIDKHRIYIQMVKNVKAGEELYTTYGHHYRLK